MVGCPRMPWERTRYILADTMKQFIARDLRWSYLINLALVVVGLVINTFFIHGWTVWPFVGAIGILVMVNEAADRNSQGVPPFQVYALFIGVLLAYAIVLLIVSALNGFIFVAAFVVVGYFALKAHMTQKEHEKLVAQRRADGQCIHCGEPMDEQMSICELCGMEPETSERERIGAVMQSN